MIITDTVQSKPAYVVAMRQICGATFIMLAVSLGYIAWRWSNFIVWDDTSSASYNMFSNNGHYSLDRIWPIVVEVFTNIQGDGYRPISGFIRGFGCAYVFSIGFSLQPFIIINGLLCGLTALVYLDFAGFFLRAQSARIFAAFLIFRLYAGTDCRISAILRYSIPSVHFHTANSNHLPAPLSRWPDNLVYATRDCPPDWPLDT